MEAVMGLGQEDPGGQKRGKGGLTGGHRKRQDQLHGPQGVIHLVSSWNHYAFNLKWLETPPPPE